MNLFDHYINEVNQKFEGWDFSYIKDRMSSFPLSWNYQNIITNDLLNAHTVLDMGTGGGEFLYSIRALLPKDTYATEGYEPNVAIAKNRLEPIGIKVSQILDDNILPFTDNKFDLIINRHEAYSIPEIRRILKPDGIFITQQVGGDNDIELNKMLKAPTNLEFSEWNLESALMELEKEFLIIDTREEKVRNRFYDIGAIIYYLKAIPWQIPDFSINKYYNSLLELHNYISTNGYLDTTCHRFFIRAKNKGK